MGNYTRIEDVTLNLGSTGHYNLTGINFGGNNTTQTAKVRTCVVNVNNSTAPFAGGTGLNVTGVLCNGIGVLSSSSFSFNSLKGSTINVYSNGAGIKRGILVSNSNQVNTRDTNIYIAQPTNPGSTGATASTGSYVGVETNDTISLLGSIQLRTTSVGCVYPLSSQSYTASDIKQTTPTSIVDPTYLASAGIQLGPGVDLVTKSAGSNGFSTYIYPTTLYYGLRGNITDGPNVGATAWCWPGTQAFSRTGGTGIFPDTSNPPAFYRIQQPSLLSGMSASLGTLPGSTDTVTVGVYYTTAGGSYPGNYNNTLFNVIFTSLTSKNITIYNSSTRLTTGDYIHLQLTYTGNTNTAADFNVQLDFF
jgi:hypothetical protein